MSNTNEDDPTCVARMLADFRSNSGLSRLKNRRSGGTAVAPVRLKFDSPTMEHNGDKKRSPSVESFPNSAKKFKDDLNTSVTDSISSPWDSRRLQADLIHARSVITTMEGRINKLHAMRTEMELGFEGEKRELLELLDHEREKVKELEKRAKLLKRRELEIRHEFEDFRQHALDVRFKAEASASILETENEELRAQLREYQMESRQSQVSTDLRLEELEVELKHAEEEAEELRERCSRLEEKASEAIRQQADAEKQAVLAIKLQVRVTELENELEMNRDMAATIKDQYHKLMHMPELEQEVASLREELAHLREAVPHKLLLEEMVVDLKKRLEHTEKVELELAEAQATRDRMQAALSEWQQVAREYGEEGAVEPSVLRQLLGTLQSTVLVATDEVAELKSQLKLSEATCEAMLCKVETAKQDEDRYRQQIEQQNQLIRRLQKKVLLITRERDSYRSQLDLYEKELTVTPSTQTQQMRARVEALEKAVEGYRDMVERLEAELEGALGTKGTAGLVDRIQRLESERDALRRDKEQLAKRRDDLERQLEHRALLGDYDPAASKLLHFRLNPAAEADAKREEEIEALKAERDSLLARVTLLEEMGERPEDLTEKVQQKITLTASEEVNKLREKVKSGDLKLQRFTEVFKNSIKEFREVCYTLLGYKVDRLETNHYKLTSVYAQSRNDHLMFKVLPNGEVNLLATEFSDTVGEHIEKYLQEQHSFPMFLSAVNMDLFAQQQAT